MRLMNTVRLHFLVLGLAAALSAGLMACAHRSSSTVPASKAGSKTQIFQVKGVVQKVEADGKTVVIQHERIPGYMEAMTMPFEVKDTKELIGLNPGDTVTFRMMVTDDEGWIDQIQKTGSTSVATPKSREAYRKAPIVEPLNPGDLMPDYNFTNQLGRAISLNQFRGQALAIVFIYTRCPYPNFCPRMSNHFLDVQKKLQALPNAPTNWQLLSITFDPAYDTPARLKTYAENWRADPAHWNFATADLWTIDGITEQLGLQFWREENAVIGHNVRAAVIDPKGRLQRIMVGNAWQPDELVEEILKAAAVR